MNKQYCYGAMILAGGQGKRMGNVEKASLTYNGDTFLVILEKLISDFSFRYLSSNNQSPAWETDLIQVTDLFPGLGPMGGIYSVLKQSPCDAVIVIPCDMPFFTKNLVDYLLSEHDGEAVLYLKGQDGREYPLCGIYTKDCLEIMEGLIRSKDLRMRQVLKKAGGRILIIPEGKDQKALVNINTPEIYQKACILE